MRTRDSGQNGIIPATTRARAIRVGLIGSCLVAVLGLVRPASAETLIDMPLPPSVTTVTVEPIAASAEEEELAPSTEELTPLERYRFARISPEFNEPLWDGRWIPRRRYSFGGVYSRFYWRRGWGWGWGSGWGGCGGGWGWPSYGWGRNVAFCGFNYRGFRPVSY